MHWLILPCSRRLTAISSVFIARLKGAEMSQDTVYSGMSRYRGREANVTPARKKENFANWVANSPELLEHLFLLRHMRRVSGIYCFRQWRS